MKAKIFGLLRQVVPSRQLEIASLMVAMDRGGNYPKMLVALTLPWLQAKDNHPRIEIATLSEHQRRAMELELSRLSHVFLSAVERRGPASPELVAASRYLNS